jgi:hypothetical protein
MEGGYHPALRQQFPGGLKCIRNGLPDASQQVLQAKRQDFDAVNFRIRKQIADQGAKLVTLAIASNALEENCSGGGVAASRIHKIDGIRERVPSLELAMELVPGPE